jgi:hypothetical protein
MMSKWLIIVLFLATMFLDGIILPGIFGFRESFLTVIFLVAMLLYYEINLQSLIIGVVLSGLTEFYWGLKLGTLILPLLASVGVFFLLNTFFNIKNRVLIVLSGVILLIVFWETSVLISKVL